MTIALQAARKEYQEVVKTERNLLALLNETKADAFGLNQFEREYLELQAHVRQQPAALRPRAEAAQGHGRLGDAAGVERADPRPGAAEQRRRCGRARRGTSRSRSCSGSSAASRSRSRSSTSTRSSRRRSRSRSRSGSRSSGSCPASSGARTGRRRTSSSTASRSRRWRSACGRSGRTSCSCRRTSRSRRSWSPPAARRRGRRPRRRRSRSRWRGAGTASSSWTRTCAGPAFTGSSGSPNEVGLSSLILGEGRLSDTIKSTEVPNLFVLPCGPVPPNPAELLHTAAFQKLLARDGERFDRVIVDSPPVGVVADAAVMSTHADGTVIVLKAGRTSREVARRAVRQLRDVNANILGAVLNDLDLTEARAVCVLLPVRLLLRRRLEPRAEG